MAEGFLVVDKTSGITSHDVVARVRRVTGVRKVGHAGTLDPMATGVVVVAVGRVTRLIRFVQDQDKEYLATAVFGIGTESLDADGTETARTEMPVTRAEVETVASRFVGRIEQIPPMVSALKHEGRRLYDLAREGVDVERRPRSVDIHELEILAVGNGPHPRVEFRVVCGKGTYVRSLADDMARELGGPAHLTALRRTRVGALSLRSAVAADLPEDWDEHLLSPAEALAVLPAVHVDADTVRMVSNGRPISGRGASGTVRVLGPDGTLLAVYTADGERATPLVVLA